MALLTRLPVGVPDGATMTGAPAFPFVGALVGTMLIYLAGLQGIPIHLYEAAEIDGATGWEKLVNITIPMMSPRESLAWASA